MVLLHDVIQRSVVALDIPQSPNGIHEHHPLIYYLEEELSRLFAIAGGVRCVELEERLNRLLRENPRKVEEIIRELVPKYYREKILKGPPDRFKEERESEGDMGSSLADNISNQHYEDLQRIWSSCSTQPTYPTGLKKRVCETR